MENATIIELENGLFWIFPSKGFVLRNKHDNTYYTMVATEDVDKFEAALKYCLENLV